MNQYSQISFLLVDDDDTDVETVLRAFRKRGWANPVHVARDGQEALGKLRNGAEEGIHRPLVILLDLNMPVMGGLEFLEALRADAELTDLVVFVLTSSEYDKDIAAAYRHHVAGYITKNRAGDGFSELMTLIKDYAATVILRAG